MPKGVAPFLVRLIQFFLLPALPPHVITGQRIFPVGGRQFVLRIGRINSVCKPAFCPFLLVRLVLNRSTLHF